MRERGVPLDAGRGGEDAVLGQAAEVAHPKHRAVMFPCRVLQLHPEPVTWTHTHGQIHTHAGRHAHKHTHTHTHKHTHTNTKI